MNLHGAVNNRVSVRTYQNEKLSNDDVTVIKGILSDYEKVNGPFGHSFELTFNVNSNKNSDGKKIGTYGIVKNVPAFIGGICQNTIDSIIDFGYVFEHVILSFTTLGFGTCWMGGTFKRKDYRNVLDDSEVIPAISPIGYPASKRSIVEKLLRKGAKSNSRLPFGELFIDSDFNPYQLGSNQDIIECLKMVQKAPSASNKQPWRVIIDNDKRYCHFFLARTENYASSLKYDIQALDIGIALAHFEIGLKHYDIVFKIENLEQPPHKTGWEYMVSFNLS